MHHRPGCRHEIRFADMMSRFFLSPRCECIRRVRVIGPLPHLRKISCSKTENRQVRILPSLVRRTRLQCPQNGFDTGAIIPISPTPSSKRIAARSRCNHAPLPPADEPLHLRTISSCVITTSGDQTRSSSSGMNSMKRTATLSSRANFPNGNLIFVEAAQQHAIHFHRREARFFRSTHPASTSSILGTRVRAEIHSLDRVHAYRHPRQSGSLSGSAIRPAGGHSS